MCTTRFFSARDANGLPVNCSIEKLQTQRSTNKRYDIVWHKREIRFCIGRIDDGDGDVCFVFRLPLLFKVCLCHANRYFLAFLIPLPLPPFLLPLALNIIMSLTVSPVYTTWRFLHCLPFFYSSFILLQTSGTSYLPLVVADECSFHFFLLSTYV